MAFTYSYKIVFISPYKDNCHAEYVVCWKYICTLCVCLIRPELTAQMGSQRGVLNRQMEAKGRECDEIDHSKTAEACGRVQQNTLVSCNSLKRRAA